MAILDPEHLFEQADLLINSRAGRPRQVDIRRAMSTAYYGLFHAAMTAAADQVIGAAHRTDSRYGLVYRSVDHKALRGLCETVLKKSPALILIRTPGMQVGRIPRAPRTIPA